MTAVVSLGTGGLTERDAVIETILRHAAAAVRRLRFAAWLGSASG